MHFLWERFVTRTVYVLEAHTTCTIAACVAHGIMHMHGGVVRASRCVSLKNQTARRAVIVPSIDRSDCRRGPSTTNVLTPCFCARFRHAVWLIERRRGSAAAAVCLIFIIIDCIIIIITTIIIIEHPSAASIERRPPPCMCCQRAAQNLTRTARGYPLLARAALRAP